MDGSPVLFVELEYKGPLDRETQREQVHITVLSVRLDGLHSAGRVIVGIHETDFTGKRVGK